MSRSAKRAKVDHDRHDAVVPQDASGMSEEKLSCLHFFIQLLNETVCHAGLYPSRLTISYDVKSETAKVVRLLKELFSEESDCGIIDNSEALIMTHDFIYSLHKRIGVESEANCQDSSSTEEVLILTIDQLFRLLPRSNHQNVDSLRRHSNEETIQLLTQQVAWQKREISLLNALVQELKSTKTPTEGGFNVTFWKHVRQQPGPGENVQHAAVP